MNILFLGAPGCGKGTQSKKLIKEYGIPQISTGDLLREEIKSGSTLGEELQEIMSTGKFVPEASSWFKVVYVLVFTDICKYKILGSVSICVYLSCVLAFE